MDNGNHRSGSDYYGAAKKAEPNLRAYYISWTRLELTGFVKRGFDISLYFSFLFIFSFYFTIIPHSKD